MAIWKDIREVAYVTMLSTMTMLGVRGAVDMSECNGPETGYHPMLNVYADKADIMPGSFPAENYRADDFADCINTGGELEQCMVESGMLELGPIDPGEIIIVRNRPQKLDRLE